MLSKNIKILWEYKILARNPFIGGDKSIKLRSNHDVFKTRSRFRDRILFQVILQLAYLIIYFVLLFNPKKKRSKVTLIYSLAFDQIFRDKSCESLRNFFMADRFNLNRNSDFIVESRSLVLHKNFENFRIVRDIPITIYAKYFSFPERFYIFVQMLRRVYISWSLLVHDSNFVLIMKEFIFDELVYSRAGNGLIDNVITTQTSLLFQPLVFYMDFAKHKRIMIWYSTNSGQIPYRNNTQQRLTFSPNFYLGINADEHWVWDKYHAKYLKKMVSHKILVKKSLLFYEPSPKFNCTPRIDILLFDITPPNSLPKNNIFNENNLCNFLSEILQVTRQLKVHSDLRIGLKPKRKPQYIHSKKYIDLVNNYNEIGAIEILDYNENLYDLIQNAKVVVGYPFTSPVLIAKELGVFSAFYSSSVLLQKSNLHNGIRFIQNKTSLERFLDSVLRDYQ